MTRAFPAAKRFAALLLALLLALSALACAWEETGTYAPQFDLGTRFLRDGNYEEGILAFQSAIEIEPRNPEAYLSLADVYLAMGDTEAAISTLIDVLTVLGDEFTVRTALEQLVPPEMSVTSRAEPDALAENAEAQKSRCVFVTEPDVTALSSLTGLEYIFLNYTGVRSLKPLSGNDKLTQQQIDDLQAKRKGLPSAIRRQQALSVA